MVVDDTLEWMKSMPGKAKNQWLPLVLAFVLGAYVFYETNGFWIFVALAILAGGYFFKYVYDRTDNVFVLFSSLIIFMLIFSFANSYVLAQEGATYTDKLKSIGVKYKDFFTKVINPFTKISEYRQKYEAKLAGDYYTGRVDQTKDEPLGVFIENLKLAYAAFYVGENVTVWGTLKAKTLDEPVDVNVGCKTKLTTTTERKGKITPQSDFTIDTEEERDFECNLPNLSEGVHSVTFNADFNFKTIAYLKNYFIDEVRLRSMRREGIDILGQYGITDKNPTAVYSNGPITIGMETQTQPIGINPHSPRFVSLGITLDNKWPGKIIRINKLQIKVPEGMTMQNKQCARRDFEEYCNGKSHDDCEEGYTLYETKNGFDIDPTKLFESMLCFFDIADLNTATKILGTTPISTRYFKVTAEYDYTTEKSIVGTVKRPPGGVLPTDIGTNYFGSIQSLSPHWSPRYEDITTIVLHYTVGNLEDTLSLFKNPDSRTKVSSHYLIAKDGTIYLVVPEKYVANHALGANENSIGIEIVNSGSEPYTSAQYSSLSKLVDYLRSKYDVKPEKILGHEDISPGRKFDPGSHFDWTKIAPNKHTILVS